MALEDCSKCGSSNTFVSDSRKQQGKDWRNRRRRCRACSYTWGTVEVTQAEFRTLCAAADDWGSFRAIIERQQAL